MNTQSDKWLKLEFQQNFDQLRYNDDKLTSLEKFFVAEVLGVIGVAIALYNKRFSESPRISIAILVLFASILGEIIYVWAITIRKYFVLSARQINSIRNYYVNLNSDEVRRFILLPTDSKHPVFINKSSSHLIALYLMNFINSILFSSSISFIVSTFKYFLCIKSLIIFSLLFIGLITNHMILKFKLKENS